MRSSSHTPRKRFGQHFLHDPRVLARIVDAIAPQPGDLVVEIGPGEGALTAPLAVPSPRTTHAYYRTIWIGGLDQCLGKY